MSHSIDGTTRADKLHGASGDDSIIAWDGNDVVHGGGGSDNIVDMLENLGSPDSDRYFGDAGDDYFRTFYGHDFLSGGSGNDTFVSFNHESFRIDGGSGNDRATIWLGDEFDVLREHHNSLGKLDNLVIKSEDQVIHIAHTEHVLVNVGGQYFDF
jgi:Ca2+-binding RTX toxin-like protein